MLLNDAQKTILKSLAEYTLRYAVDHDGKEPKISIADYPESLTQPAASFITLEKHGKLRGCIGNLEAIFPLVNDVVKNTVAAAFSDPRFEPLQKNELADIRLSISVLSAPQAMYFKDQNDLLQQLRKDEDGLILQERHYRATFLPSVWQQLPDKLSFLEHLKQKAGLTPDYWSDSIRCWRYTTDYF